MDTNRVSQELVKIAKSLVGGGGAGIQFTVDVSDSYEVELKYQPALLPEDGEIKIGKVKSLPQIDSFDAEGYMDGDRNVPGRYLKVDKVQFDDEREVIQEVEEWIRDWIVGDEGYDPSDLQYGLKVYLGKVETMIFRGYVRGTLKKGDWLELEGEAEVEIMLNGKEESVRPFYTNITLWADVTSQMEDWYHETFETEYEDSDYE